jgi:hypothetical protein
MKFGVNKLILEENSRTEEKIFFNRLENFKKTCSQSKDLKEYLTSMSKEFGKQIIHLIKSKFHEIKESIRSQA